MKSGQRASCRGHRISPPAAAALVLLCLAWADAAALGAAIPADSVRALIAAGHNAEADSAAHRLLTVAERDHGPNSIEAARALDLIVDAMSAWPESMPYALRAVRIREGMSERHDIEDAASWMNLGRAYLHSGKYHEARDPLRKALAARERVAGIDDFYLARILNNLALATEQDGDRLAGKALYERAAGILERTGPENHASLVSIYVNLGRLATDLDEFEDGEAALQKALDIEVVEGTPDSAYVAKILVHLGMLQQRLGKIANAGATLERALPLLETSGADSASLANGLDCLGMVHRDTGNYTKSKADFTRALRIREKLVGPDHQEVAVSLDALGALNDDLGDYAAARPLLERSLAIRLRKLGDRHVNVAISLLGLAKVLGEMGDLARADSLAARGIAILHANFGEKHQLIAQGLTTSATLRVKAGDSAGALALYRKALAMQEELLGAEHPDAAATGIALAHTLWDLGVREEALRVSLRSEAAAREQFRLTERTLSEREALRYAATRTNGLGLACSIARAGLADSLNREVWDALIRTRTLVLNEMAWRHRAVAAAGDSLAERLSDRLTAASSRLSNLIVRGPERSDPERYKSRIAAARQELEDAQRALAERSASYRALRTSESVGLNEVASKLPPEAALVGMARYTRSDPHRMESPAREEYMAFVLRGGERRVFALPLGDANEIESRVSRFLNDARPESIAKSRSPIEAERTCRVDGERLRRQIWDPLVPAIGSARLVLIVPDGILSLVPYAALPVGRSSYLVEEGPTIHYLTAERDVAVPWDSSHAREALLAVGGPDFDATDPFLSLRAKERHRSEGVRLASASSPARITYRGAHSSCMEFQDARFGALPSSAREARQVASLWRERHRPVGAVLTGAAASEAAFKARAPDAGVLHIATHGFFLGGPCVSTRLSERGIGGISVESMLLPAPRPPQREIRTRDENENPLLLSGLAFAGANHRDAAGGEEEDGVLTAEEIAALDLSGVRWAILSACDTGRGEVAAGEGVLGLRRAFQIAGVGSLIMSLWTVDDRAALLWMRTLYTERVIKEQSMAEAVRRASLSLLRSRRAAGRDTHPFYWAGFVPAGDWR